MIQAPLQLTDYWTTYLHVEANPDFKPSEAKPVPLKLFKVSPIVKRGEALEQPEKSGSKWDIQLTVEQNVSDEFTVPYFYKLIMQGTLLAHPSLPANRLERIVEANGPAMLFGAAREIIRASTSRGPFPAILIPSTNFLSGLETKKDSAQKKSLTKKTAKKKTSKNSKSK